MSQKTPFLPEVASRTFSRGNEKSDRHTHRSPYCAWLLLSYLVMAKRRVTNTPYCAWLYHPGLWLLRYPRPLSLSQLHGSVLLPPGLCSKVLAGHPMATHLKLPRHLTLLSVFFWCLIFLPSIYCCKYIHTAYFVFSSFNVYWQSQKESPDSFSFAPCCIVAHWK